MLKSLAEWAQSGREFAAVEFAFAVPALAAAGLLIAAGLAAVWFWGPRLSRLSPAARGGLMALRIGALLLAIFLALDPQLIARLREPSKNFVAILYDDSRSMSIDDGDGQTRGGRMQAAVAAQQAEFTDALKETFQVVEYRFGRGADRTAGAAALTFGQPETRIADAIRAVERDLAGTSVAGIVVLSDGVEQPLGEAPLEAGESAAPVFAAGAGRERAWRDLEIAHLAVTQTQFDKSPVALTVRTSATGLAGHEAVVEVIEAGRVVATAPLTIRDAAQDNQVRLEFIPTAEGWSTYTARVRLAETGPSVGGLAVGTIAVANKDSLVDNNERAFLVDNRKKAYRILYFSGRPNWENKFVARALAEDEALHLSTLLRIRGPEVKFTFRGARTGLTNPLFEGFEDSGIDAPRYDEAVFVRIGVAPDELVNGYPLDPEELYGYDLVILGDIEAGFFSQGHFEATRDFVAERGGALLMLGGPQAFAAGGYGGTMLEPVLPIVLPSSADGGEIVKPFQAKPSVEGFLSGMWAIDMDLEANARIWSEMPPLYGATVFPLTRAGSTVWARIAAEDGDIDEQPLFVWHRYGEGLAAVMATGETWSWQMNAELDDSRHERFWRQAVRSLVKDVKEPVVARFPAEDITVDSVVPLAFQVRDKAYRKREGLRTTVDLLPPSGSLSSLPVSESLEETGVYAAEFVPAAPGLYTASLLSLDAAGEEVGRTEQALLVHPDNREYRQAQFNPAYLQALAAARGGAYFEMDQLGRLADAIPIPEGDEAATLRIHLWQWPVFYALIVALLCVEWYWRRKAGQP